MSTEQERFWRGDFGNSYTTRNRGDVAANIALFASILARTEGVNSVLEVGANIGLNLRAIAALLPEAELSGIEINAAAARELQATSCVARTYEQSLIDFVLDYPRDLVLSKGVLIHINPEQLPHAYSLLHAATNRYICVAEYYNPTPVGVTYRGHENKLFKRDFAGELLDSFADLRLVDYGFCYHRAVFPQDDITWFLLEKER